MAMWDYIYINHKFSVWGRNLKVDYGNLEYYGQLLATCTSMGEALHKAYYLLDEENVDIAPRISEQFDPNVEVLGTSFKK